ncbi:MAG: type 1 glutamine amidotransferase [Ahrensia sp.]|nr:type 1 glutamine amidotransferase [Ahrensia sp.]
MNITIYDCVTGDPLRDRYGSIALRIEAWIGPHLPEAEFSMVHVAGGERMPQPDTVDGVIISGSEKGVYDDTPWMQPLRDNLEQMRVAGVPMFGICFGHQIMADVFGGKAQKADKGFVTGSRSFETANGELRSYLAHQDQVSDVPPGAEVIASAPHCPVAALAYDFPALSVQFHPEYDAAFTTDLIEMFGPQLMSPVEIEAATATLSANVPRDLYCEEVAAFFRWRQSASCPSLGE